MDEKQAQSGFDLEWPREKIDLINEAIKGRTVEALEVGDAHGYQFVLITFADGLQLRIECEHLEEIEPIEPQHI